MYGERSLNLQGARPGITISRRRPVDFPGYGKGFYQAESGAAGGAEFQHHRSNYMPTYVEGAIPIEAGYASVGYAVQNVAALLVGAAALPRVRLTHISGCSHDDCDRPVRYNADIVKSVVATPSGELVLLTNGQLWQGVDLLTGSGQPLNVTGIELGAALGAFSIGGRLCVYSEYDVHVSSAENQLDFMPSLRTQAQSFTIRYNIGRIISATGFGDSAYVWGTRGAALLQCTGEAELPYSAKMVNDFTGIYHPRNVQVDYAASSVHVWSRSGLVVVQGTSTSSTPYPDISDALAEQRLVYFYDEAGFSHDEAVAHIDGLQTVCDNTRDTLRCVQPTTLVKERAVSCGLVAVREHNQRWCTVSYGSTADRFQRLLLIDKQLQRITVLHKEHCDVAANRCCEGNHAASLSISLPTGVVQKLLQGVGQARLYFDQLTGTNRKVVKLVGCVLKGEFNLEAYPDVEFAASYVGSHSAYGSANQAATEALNDKPLSRIACIAGQDVPGRNARHNLRLLTKTKGDLHYAGCSTGHTVSTLTTFSGLLMEYILRRTQ